MPDQVRAFLEEFNATEPVALYIQVLSLSTLIWFCLLLLFFFPAHNM